MYTNSCKRAARVSRKQPRQRRSLRAPINSVGSPVFTTVKSVLPRKDFTISLVKEFALVSSTTGFSYQDVNTYTAFATLEPFASLSSFFMSMEVITVSAKFLPSTTGPYDRHGYLTIVPLVALSTTPPSLEDVNNYPSCSKFELDESLSITCKPKALLKQLGQPFGFLPGYTPTYSPRIRFGVVGGTTAVTYGMMLLTFTVKLHMLTSTQ